MNGMQSVPFVGADAHIGPRRGDIFMIRLNGEKLYKHPISLSHSTHHNGSVRLRDDVGIVPYIRVEPCTIQQTT